MITEQQRQKNIQVAAQQAKLEAELRRQTQANIPNQHLPKEYGGKKTGLEPTRYRDWEAQKGGLISDF